ncbi:MAG: hypothetical protein ABEJ70_08620, partial [Halobacteriaceae archaeon]
DDGSATATGAADDHAAEAADASPGASGDDEAVDVPPGEREDVELMEAGGASDAPGADTGADEDGRASGADDGRASGADGVGHASEANAGSEGRPNLGSGPGHEWPGGAGATSEPEESAAPDREWPDPGTDAGATTGVGDAEYVGRPERETPDDAGFVAATDESTGDGTEFVCPNCGYTQQVARTSLRAGDICPSCQKGYLGER